MPNKHDKNNLFLYIGISVILHLLILYFLPIGFLQGNAQSEGELNDYGYVQLVNYQPSPIQVNEPEPEAEVNEPVEEVEEIEEAEEETVEEIEEPKEIQEEQPIKEEITEETTETAENEPEELNEEIVENNEEVTEVEETAEETVEEAAEPVEEVQESVEETADEGTQEEENIMSSEESESEIEVVQEQQNTEESASVEQEQTQSEESSEESSEQTVQKEENNPPPPPPPTSGDLINLVVTPAFPKDLVGTRSEGQVRLIAEVSRQGTVNNITIQESSGFESMDRVALMTVERGWTFKEYQQPYRIPVLVNYYFDESDNTQVEVELGEVQFISGGE
jgi:protein TonB